MKKALSVMLLLAIGTAAAEPLLVSLDPLPYGAIQLAYNQYLIPNVGGINVLLYSSVPLTFPQPGQTLTPKTTLSLSPLPFGAVRMNDSQYMIPTVMPGVTALVISAAPLSISAAPLNIAASSPARQIPSANPTVTAAIPTASPAPAIEAAQHTPAPTTNLAAEHTSALSTADEPKPSPVGSTPELPKPAPVSTLTTETKSSTRLPRLPGLPDDLTGNITITQHSNTITFSYTLTSLGTTTYTLDPSALRLTQDGIGVRARLDRRNGNLTPGTLAPGKGEIGTITVNRATSADVQLSWLITDNAGHTYTLQATTAQQPDALSVR